MADICEIRSLNASKFAGSVASAKARPGHISFAVGPIYTATDNESESQRSCMLQSQDREEHVLEKVIGVAERRSVDIEPDSVSSFDQYSP